MCIYIYIYIYKICPRCVFDVRDFPGLPACDPQSLNFAVFLGMLQHLGPPERHPQSLNFAVFLWMLQPLELPECDPGATALRDFLGYRNSWYHETPRHNLAVFLWMPQPLGPPECDPQRYNSSVFSWTPQCLRLPELWSNSLNLGMCFVESAGLGTARLWPSMS